MVLLIALIPALIIYAVAFFSNSKPLTVIITIIMALVGVFTGSYHYVLYDLMFVAMGYGVSISLIKKRYKKQYDYKPKETYEKEESSSAEEKQPQLQANVQKQPNTTLSEPFIINDWIKLVVLILICIAAYLKYALPKQSVTYSLDNYPSCRGSEDIAKCVADEKAREAVWAKAAQLEETNKIRQAERKKELEAEQTKQKIEEDMIAKTKLENCIQAKKDKASFGADIEISSNRGLTDRDALADLVRETELKNIKEGIKTNCN